MTIISAGTQDGIEKATALLAVCTRLIYYFILVWKKASETQMLLFFHLFILCIVFYFILAMINEPLIMNFVRNRKTCHSLFGPWRSWIEDGEKQRTK